MRTTISRALSDVSGWKRRPNRVRFVKETNIVWSFLRRTHGGQTHGITKTYVYRVSAAENGRVVGGKRR